MRNTTVRTLTELASAGVDLHLLTGDLGFKVLDPFREVHPTRFTNAGVSEANMISVASGMALSGCLPVCYSMVPFLFMRAFEQVRLDVVAHRLSVTLVGVGAGLSYGHEGVSHHAIEDLAMARALPGLRVLVPGDPVETRAAVKLALTGTGPTFIRLGRTGDPVLHGNEILDLSRPLVLRDVASPVVVMATGHILAAVLEASDLLAARGAPVRVFSIPMIKPFPAEEVRAIARSASAVFTVEEHSIVGGIGTEVAEILLAQRFPGRFVKIGLPDEYCDTHGSPEWLRQHYGLDAPSIARRISAHLP
jgi:transketolase